MQQAGPDTRIVFTGVGDGVLAGTKKVGTVFIPAKINGVLYKDWFTEALGVYGIELIAVCYHER